MDLAEIGLFSLAERRLGWLDQRQQLLAQNIANTDTPGWRPRDLVPFAETLTRSQQAATPARTAPGHLPGTVGAGVPAAAPARPAARAPDGNAVSLENELMKVADDESAQELVTNLYTKYLSLFRLALGRGQS